MCYYIRMETLRDTPNPVVLTDDVADMSDYVRSREGRAAIEAGLSDIQEGRTLEGEGVLARELKRRAEERLAA
jgi:predicted transcriptional regulator